MHTKQLLEPPLCAPFLGIEQRTPPLAPSSALVPAVADGRRKGSRKKTAEERKIAKRLSNRRQYEKLKKGFSMKKENARAPGEVKREEDVEI